jgi:hypothetical protein
LVSGDEILLRFAADLRRLREKAGNPTYRELSRRAHCSAASLSQAAAIGTRFCANLWENTGGGYALRGAPCFNIR